MIKVTGNLVTITGKPIEGARVYVKAPKYRTNNENIITDYTQDIIIENGIVNFNSLPGKGVIFIHYPSGEMSKILPYFIPEGLDQISLTEAIINADEINQLTEDEEVNKIIKRIEGVEEVNKNLQELLSELKLKELHFVTTEQLNAELEANLIDFVTIDDLNTRLSEINIEIPEVDLSGYATETYVNEELGRYEAMSRDRIDSVVNTLEGKSDAGHGHMLGDVAGLEDKLEGLATEEYVNTKISTIDIPEPEPVDISGKADKGHTHEITDVENLVDALTIKADKQYVDNRFDNLIIPNPDLSDFATHSYVDDAVQSAPQPDLSQYAEIGYVDARVNSIEIPTLDGYVTEDYVDEKIASIDIPAPVDISGKADIKHKHVIDDIEGLREELSNSSTTGALEPHTHNVTDLHGLSAFYNERDPWTVDGFTSTVGGNGLSEPYNHRRILYTHNDGFIPGNNNPRSEWAIPSKFYVDETINSALNNHIELYDHSDSGDNPSANLIYLFSHTDYNMEYIAENGESYYPAEDLDENPQVLNGDIYTTTGMSIPWVGFHIERDRTNPLEWSQSNVFFIECTAITSSDVDEPAILIESQFTDSVIPITGVKTGSAINSMTGEEENIYKFSYIVEGEDMILFPASKGRAGYNFKYYINVSNSVIITR